MEKYHCSNVSSVPLIHFERKNGDTSGETKPPPSNSAEDIWADFDCAIELGHQVRREERMRELNRAYLARGPSHTDDEDSRSRPIVQIGDHETATEHGSRGHGNNAGDIPSDHEKTPTKEPEKVKVPKVNTEHSIEESLACLMEDLETAEPHSTKHSDSYRYRDDIYPHANDHAVTGNTSSSGYEDIRMTPEESHNDFIVQEEQGEEVADLPRDRYKEIRPKSSALKLQTMMSLGNQTSMHDELLVCQLTDSRMSVPMNTPVASFTAYQTNDSGYSPRESRNMNIHICANDWYAYSLQQVRYINSVEDDPNEEIEELLKQSFLQDKNTGICRSPSEKQISSGPEVVRPITHTESVASSGLNIQERLPQTSAKSSPSDSENQSSLFIRNQIEISVESPVITNKDGIDLINKRNTQPEINRPKLKSGTGSTDSLLHPDTGFGVQYTSRQADKTEMISEMKQDGVLEQLDVSRKTDPKCKSRRNIIMVQPISGFAAEHMPQDISKSDGASGAFNQSGNPVVIAHNLQRYSLRRRIHHASGRAARKFRSVFRMCIACCP